MESLNVILMSKGKAHIAITVRGQEMSYRKFDVDLDLQDGSLLEFKENEDVVYRNLDPDKPVCKARIGSKLSDREKDLFTALLQDDVAFGYGAKCGC